MTLFLIQYLMRMVDELASKGLGAWIIAEFAALHLSWIVVLAVPIGVLFSTIMAFGSLSTTYEITIMKASGKGLFQMMVPVLVCGALLWGGSFWYIDNVLPDSNLRLSTMLRDISLTRPAFAVEKGQFTTYSNGLTILARNVTDDGEMVGVTIYDKSQPDRQTVVNANSGKMAFSPSLQKIVLQLFDGEINVAYIPAHKQHRRVQFTKHEMILQAIKFGYVETEANPEARGEREMRISEMQAVVDKAEKQYTMAKRGFDSLIALHLEAKPQHHSSSQAHLVQRSETESYVFRMDSERKVINKYNVEIYKKYSIPMACIVFVLVGCPLGIITKGGNFGISAAISLGFYIVYWMSMIGGEKLADRNIISPAIGMWLGNIVIGLIGIVLSWRVHFDQ
jgi:lipopolysaccharide export system permease protein